MRAEFSQRRRQILERARELEAAGVAVGREGRERIVYDTREPKREIAEPDWRAAIRARAAEHGLGGEELARVSRLRPSRSAKPVPGAALAARLLSPTGLTANRNTFAERDVVIAVAETCQDGAVAKDLLQVARRVLQDPAVVPLGSGLDRRYTTRELLLEEAGIVRHAEHGRGKNAAILDQRHVGAVLKALPCRLSNEQTAAVAGIAASGNRIDVVEALAGTGKTTCASAVRELYEQAGYRVLGAAPTARAVRELKDRAGIAEARTLDGWAVKLALDPDTSLLDRANIAARLSPAVLVIDEAGMANTRVSAHVIDRAMTADVKVVAIGDSGQLSSVQAGGWLGALTRRLGAFELREVMRQRDPAERRALARVHRGEPESYLQLKTERGELRVLVGEHAGASAEWDLVCRWAAAREQYGETEAVMICRDNHRRERLNEAARAHLRGQGELGNEVEIAGTWWAVGDRVIARRNNRARDLDNGMRGTITALDEHHGATIRLDSGADRRLDAEYLARHVEPAHAVTGHSMQGGTVEWAGVIGQPHDFSRNWSYTALSRARQSVEVFLTDERPSAAQEREEIAPIRRQEPGTGALERMRRRMRERDDEDLALEQLDYPEPLRADELEPEHHPAGAVETAPRNVAVDPEGFLSPARERAYELERQLDAIHRQQDALPNRQAKSIVQITESIAAIEGAHQRDRRPRGWRDLPARYRRKQERERNLERLRHHQAELLQSAPDPNAVLDRSRELLDQQRAIGSEHRRVRAQAITDELARRPPWLEHTLGPEPDHDPHRARWQQTAREIAGHRIDHHVTDPHTALDQRARELSLTRAISDTRAALGVDVCRHGHDSGYEL